MAKQSTSEVMVKIKGDNKNLDDSLRKSKSSLKNFGASAKSAGLALAKMAAVGIVAAAGFTAVTWGLTKSFKDYGLQLDEINKTMGVNATISSQMAYAAEQEHASLEDLLTGWKKLSKSMSDANDGAAVSVEVFDALGISVQDSSGNLKSLDEMTLEIADAMKGMTNETQKAALAQDLFGKSGLNLIPFLNMGADGIQALMAESKALGNVWTNEMAEGAKVFDDKLTALNYSLKAMKWQIGNALMPEFEKITDWFMLNKEWLITSIQDIFQINESDVTIGDKIVEQLERIKTWVGENEDLLTRMWTEPLRAATELYDRTVEIGEVLGKVKAWTDENIKVVPSGGSWDDPNAEPNAWQSGPSLGYDTKRALSTVVGVIPGETAQKISIKLDAMATREFLSGRDITRNATLSSV